jgi:hypothetical protein
MKYNEDDWSEEGINKDTGTMFDQKGWSAEGINRDTGTKYDKDGYAMNGITTEDAEKTRLSRYIGLLKKAEKLANGEMSVEEYFMKSKMSMAELIVFARKEKMSSDVIRKLSKLNAEYTKLVKPFDKKKYLSGTQILVGDTPVTPTSEDVDKCIKYLTNNGRPVRNSTVCETVRMYLRGEIDVEIADASKSVSKSRLVEKEQEQQELENYIEKLDEVLTLVDKQNENKKGEKSIEIGE